MIDLVLLLLLFWNIAIGFRQGLAIGVLSVSGFIGGALLAVAVAPPLAGRFLEGVARSAVVLAVVLVAAWLGQLLGGVLGVRLRRRLDLPVVRTVDQVLGALAGLLAACLVLWFVGGSVREVAPPQLARQVASSQVLAAIDRVVPRHLADLAADFRQRVSTSAFPRVFEGVRPEPLVPVAPPDAGAMAPAVQAQVRRSVVKITGDAPACERGQEGSGAVIAPRTGDHQRPRGGRGPPSRRFSSPGTGDATRRRSCSSTRAPTSRSSPSPACRPRRCLSGRICSAVTTRWWRATRATGPTSSCPRGCGSTLSATGEDIYGGAGAVRQVYSLFTTVEQGNSGGPVVAVDGSLAGVVFAKSLDDAQTGYALTLTEVREEIRTGIAARTGGSAPGGCTVG